MVVYEQIDAILQRRGYFHEDIFTLFESIFTRGCFLVRSSMFWRKRKSKISGRTGLLRVAISIIVPFSVFEETYLKFHT